MKKIILLLLLLVVLLLLFAQLISADEPINVNTKTHLVSTPTIIDFSAVTVLGLPFNQYSFQASLISDNGTVTLVNDTYSPGILEYYGTDGNGTLGYHNLCSGLSFADSIINTGGIVTLVGDTDTPAASQYYGTNGSSVLGFYDLPSGGGSVNSVFGRSGDVVATTGDYTAAQVTNAVDSTSTYSNPAWITGLIWSKITSTPTTLSGYGITDAQPLDSDLTAIAALTTDAFGRALLTKTDGASVRSYIGAGTSSFDGTFGSLTGKPTTLSGYGITDAQPLDSDLTAIAALSTTSFGRGFLTQADATASRSYIGAGTGSGDALTANPLSQFASTTSAQLRGVLTDESGTGVFLTDNGSAANLTSFPTFNQNTTGSAATLTTARNLWGQSFNGSASVAGAIELGTSGTTDTTLDRSSAGHAAIEGSVIGLASDNLGFFTHSTSASIGVGSVDLGTGPVTITGNAGTGRLQVGGVNIPVSTDTLSFFTASTVNAIGVGTIELGHANDTTLSRLGSAILGVEGVAVPTISSTSVLTNKDLTSGTNTFPTFNQNTTGSSAKWTTARNLAGNSVDGSANVSFANKFIVQGTSDSGLSAAQFLGALGTGIVKNTTTTGVLSIATSSDVVGLFSSCSGTQYLGADGACHTAGGGGTIATTTNVLKGDNAGNAISTGLAAPTGAFVGTTDTQALTNKDLTGSGNTFPPDKGKVHYVGYNWNGFGTALVAADMVGVITVPYAGTITGYAISVDTGTCTVKTYKKATGTAIPTSGDNISTSGVAISTGTHLKSSTTSDFTTTTVTAYDQFLFTLSAVSSATFVTFQLEITE